MDSFETIEPVYHDDHGGADTEELQQERKRNAEKLKALYAAIGKDSYQGKSLWCNNTSESANNGSSR